MKAILGVLLVSLLLLGAACSGDAVLAEYKYAEISENMTAAEFKTFLQTLEKDEDRSFVKNLYVQTDADAPYTLRSINQQEREIYIDILFDLGLGDADSFDITRDDVYSRLGADKQRALSSERNLQSYIIRVAAEKYFEREAEKRGLEQSPEFQQRLEKHLQDNVRHQVFVQQNFPALEEKMESFSIAAKDVQKIQIQIETQRTIFDEAAYARERTRIMAFQDANRRRRSLEQLESSKARMSRSVALGSAEIQRNEQKAEEAVQAAYAMLQQGAEFEELARVYSTHPSGKDGGQIGLIVARQTDKPSLYLDVLEKLEPGAHSEPFRIEHSWYILKCNEEVQLSHKNFSTYFSTEQSERMHRLIRESLIAEFVDDIRTKDAGISLFPEVLLSDDPSAVVLKVQHEEYTHSVSLEEYLSRAQLYFSRVRKIDKTEFSLEERQEYYEHFVKEEILRYGPYAAGIHKSSAFKKEQQKRIDQYRWMIFAELMFEADIPDFAVSEEDIREEYRIYRERLQSTSKKPEKIYTFEEAALKIRPWMENKRKEEALGHIRNRVGNHLRFRPENYELEEPAPPASETQKNQEQSQTGGEKKNRDRG